MLNGSDIPSLTFGNERPSTTTISTIAVQSGKARIVIALLHAGTKISFKVRYCLGLEIQYIPKNKFICLNF